MNQLGPAARTRVPALLEQLRGPELQTQQAAARALAAVLEGDPASVLSHLKTMLQSREPVVRTGGAVGLGEFGPAAAPALDTLIAQLDDPHVQARRYAAVALGDMGAAAGAALPRLATMERERDYRVSAAARQAIASIRKASGPARSRR